MSRVGHGRSERCYLRHIRLAWDAVHGADPLAEQDVVVTLPASFDEVARELTIEAAKRAGLPRIFLLEEPQAAFYHGYSGMAMIGGPRSRRVNRCWYATSEVEPPT